ncbi:hypothetical protein TKK_0008576 [Trichogramma kaykai]|uniref:WASH complex subunit strumpellin n=1 Tax=Trichogramma kaykai TaxID=54128 RepID=A0ABD2X692_9HYME
MGDFLRSSNSFGQTLLRLVARGNAIIAELMRLKNYLPPLYRLESKHDVQKYGVLIVDFAYFKAATAYEQKIENNPVLQELDEELRKNYSDILSRFYSGFESIHKYITDFNSYIDEMEDGTYLQESFESVMMNEEGKQLICEAIYLYGIMLLSVDCYFDGQIRERLLVSYYRYNVQKVSSTRVDDVCLLLRSTGFSRNLNKRPQNYPESYFQRIPISESVLDLTIAHLRLDEIYNQTSAYPHPDHRSIALSNQASMLVIILCFKPSILITQSATMREIVDRFFPDIWVISVYMGIIIDLVDWWSPYKAAKAALNNTLENSHIKKISQKYGQLMEKQLIKTGEALSSLNLDEGNIGSVIKLTRDCNVTLHWIMLHTATPTILIEDSKRLRNLKQQLIQDSKYTVEKTLRLLLNSAQIEYNIKQMYKQLLQDKENKWVKNKEKCILKINRLADAFSGVKQLDDIEKNQTLENWFREISKHIESVLEDDGKKIMQLLQALEEVQEFHQLENNLQILQYLKEARQILHNMLRSSLMNEDTIIALNIVTDCCYAWNIMEAFIPEMQNRIKADPSTVIQLKALLSKMASALEMPLLRINQIKSPDLASVSQYYSRELESYARHVLQIIPESVFAILAQIVDLETNVFHEIPSKLHKDKVKDYAQSRERLKMAELTYSISIFTNGMLSLESVSLGILRVDSHRLLEDGIRQELVKKVTLALHNSLVFDAKSKDLLVNKLQALSTVMDGYRKSFQYIQDYTNINSLKIWHEEISYIISKAVEEECKGSLWTPGKPWLFLPEEKPLINLQPTDSNSQTFMGRLAREITRITDPKTTMYAEREFIWYDLKTQAEVSNHKIFSMILQAMDAPGLIGLDKIYSYFIATEIQRTVKFIDSGIKSKTWANTLKECETFQNSDHLKGNRSRFLLLVNNLVTKSWVQLFDSILKIGHWQLLRQKISCQLNSASQSEAQDIEASLRTLNDAVLAEVEEKGLNSFEPEFLNELSAMLVAVGITDVKNKIYFQPPKINNIDNILFLLTVPQLHKIHFCKNLAYLTSKKIQDPVDPIILILGLQTFLKQFGIEYLNSFVTLVSKYILSFIESDCSKLSDEFETETIAGLRFLELFTKHAGISKKLIYQTIPILACHHYEVKLLLAK